MNTNQQIQKILKSDFEKQLFKACLKNLEDENNILRYHNFCYSIRELSRHFLYSLSPEVYICKCPWFVIETKDGRSSRRQKIKFAIQGGLEDKFLSKLGYDINELDIVIKEIKSTIDSLNKFTHINPENFILTEIEIEKKSGYILETFAKFVNTINDCKEYLKTFLSDQIEQYMIDKIISNSYENIDSLAPHFSINYGEVYEYYLDNITDNEIIVNVYGGLHVTLEYGSKIERANDDGIDIKQSFPFKTKVKYEISNKFPSGKYIVEEFDVDTSEWFS